MKIRTLIVDDEPIALRKLEGYVEKVPFLELVGAYSSALDALAAMQTTEVDVVFTDINMPDLDGMNFISTLDPRPMVVFTTAYPEFAVESYRLSAIDYLLKPYGFADFQRAANKVARQYSLMYTEEQSAGEKQDHLFIKVDSRYRRVNFDEILYIKGYGEYLQVFIKESAAPLVTLSSFAEMIRHLPDYFLQVHRSYVVNMQQAVRVERMRVVLADETYIPVSDSFKTKFLDYLKSRAVGFAQR